MRLVLRGVHSDWAGTSPGQLVLERIRRGAGVVVAPGHPDQPCGALHCAAKPGR